MTLPASMMALALVACGSPEGDDTTGDDTTIQLDETGGGETSTPPDPETDLVVGEDACETDADCVPAACCHAAACVAVTDAPACEDVMCTAHCAAQTLDCGGACLCHEGRCAARLNDLGPPEVVQ
ncbi:MAG: hypothetical protein AB7S26_09145 [Sandaracinaceae bacterium]